MTEPDTQAPIAEFGVVTEARTVCIRRVLPGPIARVWAFLTESEKRAKWLAAGEMELRVGGRVELEFHHADLAPPGEQPPERYRDHSGHRLFGYVTRCEPPRLLSYTWDEGARPPSEVTFELTPAGEDVLLVLTHRRLPDRPMMVGVASGWHTHLGILVDRLEGRDLRPFWPSFERWRTEYDQRIPPD